MENNEDKLKNEPLKPSAEGIDQWNDRLDTNLENEQNGDPEADEKAREYSEEEGSGDQSDASED